MKFQNRFNLTFLRFANLILYKFIFIVYTLYIYWGFEHYYDSYIYVIGIICYVIYYIFGGKNNIKYSHLGDFCIIFLFLYGKHLSSFGFATYLMMPIFFRGVYLNSKNIDKYFSLEYIVLLFSLCIFPDFDGWRGAFHLIVPVSILLFVNHLYTHRWITDDFVAEMLDMVDNYYTREMPSYHIYRSIINLSTEKNICIKNIACFSADENLSKLHLVNSSSLIYEYQYSLNSKTKEELKKYDFAMNAKFILDGKHAENNVIYLVQRENLKGSNLNLLFVLFFKKDNERQIRRHLLDYERFFTKMSKVIIFESNMQIKRYQKIQNMQQKSRFVNAAIRTMHFIKNRLTPFQTLLDYLNNEGNIQSVPKYPILLRNVKISCSREMNDILERAKFLLNKDNNPFQYQELTNTDSRNIYTLLRSIWSNTFPNEYDNLKTIGRENCYIPINMDGTDVLFSDIIGNMKKYSLEHRSCIFEVNDDELKITFKNDFADIHSVSPLVQYMNGDEKDEALFRVSHGTSLIKQNCKDQNISHQASITESDKKKIYNLILTIKSI